MPYLVLIVIGLVVWAACSPFDSEQEEAVAEMRRAAQAERRLQELQELKLALSERPYLMECLSEADGSHAGIVQDVKRLLREDWDRLEVVASSFELGQTSVAPKSGEGRYGGGAHTLEVRFSARNRYPTRDNPNEKRHFVGSATFSDDCGHDENSVKIAERRVGTFAPFHDLSPSERSALRRTLREQLR